MMNSNPRYQAVWSVVARIPAGRVMSYGRVADAAGQGRAARLVGTALRAAPAELELPWHRVINASGRISFPPGSQEYCRQRGLLESEGLSFVNGRICEAKFVVAENLDRSLWGDVRIDAVKGANKV